MYTPYAGILLLILLSDYWKSEVITFVVVFLFFFLSSSVVDFNVKYKVRSRALSVSSILFWIDKLQIITKSRIVQ